MKGKHRQLHLTVQDEVFKKDMLLDLKKKKIEKKDQWHSLIKYL